MSEYIGTPAQGLRDDTAIWRVKIDYVSLTSGEFHVPLPISNKDARTYSTDGEAACRSAGIGSLSEDRRVVWKDAGGRSGYAVSSSHEVGARIFFGHEKAPPLAELGGAACDTLFEAGELLPLISRNTNGVTRIDLAADIKTDVSPFDFIAAGRGGRQKSISRINSAKGQTVYIGSPHSERRMRVYRYFEPHPRHEFLRVEVMCRDELARAAATDVLLHGIGDAWRAAITPYGLEHELIYGARTDRKMERTLRNEPTSAGKLVWIHKQVVPALRAAIKSGLISADTLMALLEQD